MTKLKALRDKIDAIDAELISLFAERMAVSAEIARLKKEKGLSVYDPGREEEILRLVAARCDEEMKEYTSAMFSALFDLSRGYQRALTEEEGASAEELGGDVETTTR